MKVMKHLKSAFTGLVMGFMGASAAFGQASLLPNANQRYVTDTGAPVANGTVDYYIPGTTTRKTVWQDAAETTPQANPVLLDAGGKPQPAGQTYGSGSYRQVVKDQTGLTIWDAVTTSAGSGSSGSVAFSEGVMVGTVILWTNPVLPAKYLYTAGQAISRTTYPDLFTALTVQQVILCQSGIATITVPASVSDIMPIGAKIEATCFAPGTTVSAKSSGQLTMSTNATTTTSVTATLFPWGNGDGATTFNVPDLRGRIPVGRDNMNSSIAGNVTSTYFGSNPDAINAQGGSQSTTLSVGNIPTLSTTGTASVTVNTTSSQVVVANGGSVTQNLSGGGSPVTTWVTNTVATPSTVTSTGGGSTSGSTTGTTDTPFSQIQPALTSDYIIKALPDDLPTGPGVTSIQGMTGAIACGAGLLCTGNTITTTVFVQQSPNVVLAGPTSGALATPTFRALVGADLPTPGASSLGGVQSLTCGSNTWFSSLSTGGIFGCTQPSFTSLTGSLACSQTPALTSDVTTSAGSCATTIAAGVVTNAKLANSASGATLKGNPTSAGAAQQDFTIQGLTARGAPDPVNDKLIIYDNAAGTLKSVTPAQVASSATAGVSSLNGLTGALVMGLAPPGGRLTPSSGVCVPTTDAAAVTAIYYAPCLNPYVPLYNGTNVQAYNFTSSVTDTIGLTLTLGSNWAANTLYDVFVTLNAGNPVLCTVAWSASTAGASTRATALGLYAGMQTNGVAIAACRINNTTTIAVSQNQGTYVGTFLTNGTAGQVDFKFGGSAAGGNPGVAGVWNMYNRTPGSFYVNDTTVNFGASIASTYQPLDIGGTGAGLNNRITFVTGTGTDPINANITLGGQPTTGTMEAGVGLNVTNAINTRCTSWLTGNTAAGVVMNAPCNVYAPVGLNYAQAIMFSTNTASPFISGKYGALTAIWWW